MFGLALSPMPVTTRGTLRTDRQRPGQVKTEEKRHTKTAEDPATPPPDSDLRLGERVPSWWFKQPSSR